MSPITRIKKPLIPAKTGRRIAKQRVGLPGGCVILPVAGAQDPGRHDHPHAAELYVFGDHIVDDLSITTYRKFYRACRLPIAHHPDLIFARVFIKKELFVVAVAARTLIKTAHPGKREFPDRPAMARLIGARSKDLFLRVARAGLLPYLFAVKK